MKIEQAPDRRFPLGTSRIWEGRDLSPHNSDIGTPALLSTSFEGHYGMGKIFRTRSHSDKNGEQACELKLTARH
jgi:hypothetical protein